MFTGDSTVIPLHHATGTVFVEPRDRFASSCISTIMTPLHGRRSIALALALTAISTLTGCDDPVVMQTNHAARAAYEEQAQEWTQWALGQPQSTESPIADETGAMCGNDQSGKVWYLAGTFSGPVERSCTIPAKRYLFFPLVNRWIINPPGYDFWESDEAYLEFAEEWFADHRARTCSITLRLDGEDLLGDDLEELDDLLYVDVIDPFIVDINADNWATEFGFLGGDTPTVTDGHFALLRPLDEGEHVLEFGASICDGKAIEFETLATYNLTVEE
jgi:hypothetical protein